MILANVVRLGYQQAAMRDFAIMPWNLSICLVIASLLLVYPSNDGNKKKRACSSEQWPRLWGLQATPSIGITTKKSHRSY